MRNKSRLITPFLMLVVLMFYNNCGEFQIGDGLSNSSFTGQGEVFAPSEASGMRLLSAREYDNSLEAILGETSQLGQRNLPEDEFAPFDNFTENLEITETRVTLFDSTAEEAVNRFLADSQRMAEILPCTPQTPDDTDCITKIVSDLGLVTFRRPLTDERLQKFTGAMLEFSTKTGDYKAGLAVVLKAMLQHPAFLYRWENGAPVDGNGELFQLDDFELASRLAFTLWGTGPDRALLQAAAEGKLRDRTTYGEIVEKMLNDERTVKQVDFFHAAWLGYYKYKNQNELSQMMRQETLALIKRVVFQQEKPWSEVLTSSSTYVTRTLASHYGLPEPIGEAGWVEYDTEDRRGLLSHGSFLSVGGKFGDTSPVQRGYNIRKSLFCGQIPQVPDDVNVDDPPTGEINSNCKQDHHYASTLKPQSSCLGCHQSMDPIGFGLERYTALGTFREVESEHPECSISGEGEVLNFGRFNGPAELGKLALESGKVEECLVERWVQLTFGRESDGNQPLTVTQNLNRFQRTGKLQDLIKDFVMSYDFRFRKNLE